MAKQDGWKKVEMSPVWDFKAAGEGAEMVGVFTRMETGVGDNNSNMYHFEQENGGAISVWGNAVLDVRLKNIKVGEEVKLVYLGKEKSEKTGKSYHNFDVYHRPLPFELVAEEEYE
jgi:hypothetical protein